MKAAFYIMVFSAIFLYLSDTEITLKPFSIKMESWKYGLGWLLMGCGVTLLLASSYETGVKAGADDVRDKIIIAIDSLEKENKNK
jgi:hypothetical protein